MPSIGSLAVAVNSKKMNVYIGSTSNEFIFLQNARMGLNHSEDPEDTTSGGAVYFSGNDRFFLEGSLLYTEGLYDENIDGTTSIEDLLTRTNGEVAENTWVVKMTAKDGSSDTFTFTAKLESFEPNASVPGGTKSDVRLVIISAVTAS